MWTDFQITKAKRGSSVALRTAYRTRAQAEILDFLKASSGKHFTAAEIWDHFSKEDHPIGTATVYRQLEKFVEDGIVRKYVLGPGECACYAYAEDLGCATHFHCKCERCGRLIHLDCDELQEIRAHLQEHHGFAWNTGKTVFYGICDRCQEGTEGHREEKQ